MILKQNIFHAFLALVPVTFSLDCSGRTEAGEVLSCIFPFKLSNGTQLQNCTAAESDTGHPWCPTRINATGFEIKDARGECTLECAKPALRHDRVLSISKDGCNAGYLPRLDTNGRIETEANWFTPFVPSYRPWSCPMTMFIPASLQRLYFRVDSAYTQGGFHLPVLSVEFFSGHPRAGNLITNLTEKSVRLGQVFASSPGDRTVTVLVHFQSSLMGVGAFGYNLDGDKFSPQIAFSLTPFPEDGTTAVPVKLCPTDPLGYGRNYDDCVQRTTTTRRPYWVQRTTPSPYGGDYDSDSSSRGADDDDISSYVAALVFFVFFVIAACTCRRRRQRRGGCCGEADGTTTHSTSTAYHYSAPGQQQQVQPVVAPCGTVVPGGSPAAPDIVSPYVPTGGGFGTQPNQPPSQAHQPTPHHQQPSAPPLPIAPNAGPPNYAATEYVEQPPPPSYDEAVKLPPSK